jgi:hypothetical protein
LQGHKSWPAVSVIKTESSQIDYDSAYGETYKM